ncbi:MAG: hypothetical protein E6R04_11305 [Spirochaetes bacterium]|nr:MAG: hypothetical protein E6R04_11305 [Spirochaetota bacterium]
MSKEYSVKCTVRVNLTESLRDNFFQKTITVVSPKTGQELSDIRLDYLNAGMSSCSGEKVASREATFQKILKGFDTPTERAAETWGRWWRLTGLEVLTAMIPLTAEDLRNIYDAWDEWQERKQDYAD